MEDWQEVEFDKIGSWNIGIIIVDNLKAGEYTLAVKESGLGSAEPNLPGKSNLDIYPNPSPGNFTIISGSETGGVIRIYTGAGALVKTFPVRAGHDLVNWRPERLAAGNYLVALYPENAPRPEIKKILYLPDL
jgi:hypothetical protein